jgi:hypothetical protein
MADRIGEIELVTEDELYKRVQERPCEVFKGRVVGIALHKDRVIVALETGVFELIDGVLRQIPFEQVR